MMHDVHYSGQGMHVFQGCVTFALETFGCIFLSTTSVGTFFLLSLWNLSQWMLRVKSVVLNDIFSISAKPSLYQFPAVAF